MTQTSAVLYAREQAENIVEAIKKSPDDLAALQAQLDDLKARICRAAAQNAGMPPNETLIWGLAHELPNFEIASLYRSRSSLLSLVSGVLTGWFLGGLLATLLGFLGLGGDILRPAVIVAILWLEDYLAANAKARRIFLTVLGLGALARFAATITQGIGRLAGMGGFRQLIFGAGKGPNILRGAWLWIGAIFLYVFFAKKYSSLDVGAFRSSLEEQITQKYDLMLLVCQEIGERERKLDRLQADSQENGACGRNDCPVVEAAISLLDSLPPDQKSYLAGALALADISVTDQDADIIYWDSEKYAKEYQPIGLIAAGDKCVILERPRTINGILVKGRVQRMAK